MELNNCVSNVFTQESKENAPSINSRAKCTIISQIVVKEENIKSKLQDFKPSKSTVLDRIHPCVLEELSEELAPGISVGDERQRARAHAGTRP